MRKIKNREKEKEYMNNVSDSWDVLDNVFNKCETKEEVEIMINHFQALVNLVGDIRLIDIDNSEEAI